LEREGVIDLSERSAKLMSDIFLISYLHIRAEPGPSSEDFEGIVSYAREH